MRAKRRGAVLAELLERTARAIHSRRHTAGLYPAQWVALRYFAKADPARRTAVALARFQGIAVGPVTRTVRTLVGKGLLKKAGAIGRGRAQRIDLTPAALALLARDPMGVLADELDRLPLQHREAFATAIEVALATMQSLA